MCKKCHKYKKCSAACIALMRVPKKDLTSEEFELIHAYQSIARSHSIYHE